jgi:hypothetical protein
MDIGSCMNNGAHAPLCVMGRVVAAGAGGLSGERSREHEQGHEHYPTGERFHGYLHVILEPNSTATGAYSSHRSVNPDISRLLRFC